MLVVGGGGGVDRLGVLMVVDKLPMVLVVRWGRG